MIRYFTHELIDIVNKTIYVFFSLKTLILIKMLPFLSHVAFHFHKFEIVLHIINFYINSNTYIVKSKLKNQIYEQVIN